MKSSQGGHRYCFAEGKLPTDDVLVLQRTGRPVATLQEIVARTGLVWALQILGGGVLYSIGAAAYALKKPNPYPKVFGYHGKPLFALFCPSRS